MTNIFQDAKPGDEFVCHNGESRWFVGWTRNGYAVVEDVDGLVSNRHLNGLAFFGDEGILNAYNIVRRKAQPVTRWVIIHDHYGFSTIQDAKMAKLGPSLYPNPTIVRVTFTPGEDQE